MTDVTLDMKAIDRALEQVRNLRNAEIIALGELPQIPVRDGTQGYFDHMVAVHNHMNVIDRCEKSLDQLIKLWRFLDMVKRDEARHAAQDHARSRIG